MKFISAAASVNKTVIIEELEIISKKLHLLRYFCNDDSAAMTYPFRVKCKLIEMVKTQ